ncbi:hypothetical protein G7Z17_g9563 [Cylindrodendrum hubeiense]|uniref:DUF1763-domain-containing protein n=1 Tax=Cylindrodendrum hubeiense TaxID=595255 RepID=A0A9P5H071_9HYPO|nr:hypothetical protein G7Z17_g9563 [Cylindrodendrum hubeiense]
MAANIEVVHAYRNLYRSLLQGVQYAFPARAIARNQLRTAFREPGAVFDREGIRRTVWFLQCATRERGMEHTILKNLLKVQQRRAYSDKGWRKSFHESKKEHPLDHEMKTRYWHYDMTVAMLNKTMGLCLR